MNKRSNFETSTGHRCISKGKTAYKISIHYPDDTRRHFSVGFIKLGEAKGLKKAIKKRDQLGREAWGKYWDLVLSDPYLFTRLPHSLEPSIVYQKRPTKSDPDRRVAYYIAKWVVDVNEKGQPKYKTAKASVAAHGKLAAYGIVKRELTKALEPYIDVLSHMDRFNVSRML